MVNVHLSFDFDCFLMINLLAVIFVTGQVCGINMRNATKDLAARVLQQCGGSINMLVQYNPDSK